MTKDEALKMAIEFMNNIGEATFSWGGMPQVNKLNEAINACKEALQTNALDEMQKVTEKEYYQEPKQGIELEWYNKGWTDAIFEFEGLTDDEINEIVRNVSDDMYPWKGNMLIGKISRAIEQALKDKNT